MQPARPTCPTHAPFSAETNYQISFAAYKANLTNDAGGQMLNQVGVSVVNRLGVVFAWPPQRTVT